MINKATRRKQAQLIFERWKADLINRDRSHSKLLDNFDDLFYEMYRCAVDFDTAHEFLEQAILAHLPDKRALKYTYARTKGHGLSESEFLEKWKNLIKDQATNAFFFRFPLPKEEEQEDESLPSGMSKEEYIRQRRYADSFPTLDLSKIPDPEDFMSDDDVSSVIADLEGDDG